MLPGDASQDQKSFQENAVRSLGMFSTFYSVYFTSG